MGADKVERLKIDLLQYLHYLLTRKRCLRCLVVYVLRAHLFHQTVCSLGTGTLKHLK